MGSINHMLRANVMKLNKVAQGLTCPQSWPHGRQLMTVLFKRYISIKLCNYEIITPAYFDPGFSDTPATVTVFFLFPEESSHTKKSSDRVTLAYSETFFVVPAPSL